jgi:antitoxin MazE
MITRIQKWGNSLAVRIPKPFAESVGFDEGTSVNLDLDRDRLVLTKVPSYLSADEFSVSVSKGKVDEWKASTWQLVPNLNLTELEPPAIQWALVNEDPVPRFVRQIKRRQATYAGRLADPPKGADAELARVALSQVAWNFVFRPTTGDEIYLLVSAVTRRSAYATSKIKERVWFATKPVELNGKVVAWSIPLQPEIGVQSAIELTLDNSIDLTSMVEEIISEQAADGRTSST